VRAVRSTSPWPIASHRTGVIMLSASGIRGGDSRNWWNGAGARSMIGVRAA
jgi:hypothetical protein